MCTRDESRVYNGFQLSRATRRAETCLTKYCPLPVSAWFPTLNWISEGLDHLNSPWATSSCLYFATEERRGKNEEKETAIKLSGTEDSDWGQLRMQNC